MRVFLIAAAGAALLAGCSPFEHGHYANDVNYVNAHGDPAGTPLVYGRSWEGNGYKSKHASRVAHKPIGHHRGYTHHAQSYVQPTYSAPIQTTGYQPAVHSTNATTYGGIRFDADGYAICDESYPQGYKRY